MKKDELGKYKPDDIVEIRYKRVYCLEKDKPITFETVCVGYFKEVIEASVVITDHKPATKELPIFERATHAIPLEDIIEMHKLFQLKVTVKKGEPRIVYDKAELELIAAAAKKG